MLCVQSQNSVCLAMSRATQSLLLLDITTIITHHWQYVCAAYAFRREYIGGSVRYSQWSVRNAAVEKVRS